MTERARETLHEARDAARESLTQATETAVSLGERTAARLRNAVPAGKNATTTVAPRCSRAGGRRRRRHRLSAARARLRFEQR